MNKLLFTLFALLSVAFSAAPTQQQICYNDVAGFNQGVNKLINDILVTKDVWAIFADLDSLDEVSYHLKSSCENFTLNLFAKQTPGQNATQYQACGHLVGIVGSLLEENNVPGFRGTAEGGVLLSQEAVGLSEILSKDCKITLAIDTSKVSEDAEDEEEAKAGDEDDDEEGQEVAKRELGGKGKDKKKEEKEEEKEEKKHKKDKKEDEEKEKEESDDKDEKEEKKEKKHKKDKKDKKHKKEEKEESHNNSSDSSDSDDEGTNKGIHLQLGDAHDGKQDSFTVDYNPSKKGVPQINIQHSSADLAPEESDSSDESDEPDYLVNLIEVSKPGDADSGQQWKSGDYNKYMNVSDWQTGGFKRFYEAGMGDEEEDGEVPPVLLDF